MKKIIIICAIIVLLVASIGIWFINRPFKVITMLDKRYKQVEKGMTIDKVKEVMNHENSVVNNAKVIGFWDDSRLPEEVSKRIDSSLEYQVSTFFLTVTFEFNFDIDNKVIGRHRYD